MNIRLRIKTPKGRATSAERDLRLLIIGKWGKPPNTYVNAEENEFYWELENIKPKQYIGIVKKVAMFENLARGTLGLVERNKFLRKAAETLYGAEATTGAAFRETEELFKHTRVEVLKNATAEELLEDGVSFWERIKRTFKGVRR